MAYNRLGHALLVLWIGILPGLGLAQTREATFQAIGRYVSLFREIFKPTP